MLIHRTLAPYVEPTHYQRKHFENQVVYPFAILVDADVKACIRTRGDSIEQALEVPGKKGILALLALRRDMETDRGRLKVPEAEEPLINSPLPQKGVPIWKRRIMMEVGKQLQRFELFSDLSVAEAVTLASYLKSLSVAAGDAIMHELADGDTLYLIRKGCAELQVTTACGQERTVDRLGPGDFFGETELLTGERSITNVRAVTELDLLCLSGEAYRAYLSRVVDVVQKLTRISLSRTARASRMIRASYAETRTRGAQRPAILQMAGAGQADDGRSLPLQAQ
jgi:CRP-like cAMP-binding protein